MAYVGVVRGFDAAEEWGVIDGPDVPGGGWVHFSAIAMEGYRLLRRGQRVSFARRRAIRTGSSFGQ